MNSEKEEHKILLKHLQDYYSRRNQWPALHDPLTASVALGKDFVHFEEIYIDFNEEGEYKKGTQTKVVTSKVDCDVNGFLEMMLEYL